MFSKALNNQYYKAYINCLCLLLENVIYNYMKYWWVEC